MCFFLKTSFICQSCTQQTLEIEKHNFSFPFFSWIFSSVIYNTVDSLMDKHMSNVNDNDFWAKSKHVASVSLLLTLNRYFLNKRSINSNWKVNPESKTWNWSCIIMGRSIWAKTPGRKFVHWKHSTPIRLQAYKNVWHKITGFMIASYGSKPTRYMAKFKDRTFIYFAASPFDKWHWIVTKTWEPLAELSFSAQIKPREILNN